MFNFEYVLRQLKKWNNGIDSTHILILLNKYEAFYNYVNNNSNNNDNNNSNNNLNNGLCNHILYWVDSHQYKDDSLKTKYFHDMLINKKLNCGIIIDLIKYKIKKIFEHHNFDVSKFEQNIFVTDLLFDCHDYNHQHDLTDMRLPLKIREMDHKSRSRYVLDIWIEQQGMENVLTKDLITIILKYCQWFANITSAGEIFARIQQICTK